MRKSEILKQQIADAQTKIAEATRRRNALISQSLDGADVAAELRAVRSVLATQTESLPVLQSALVDVEADELREARAADLAQLTRRAKHIETVRQQLATSAYRLEQLCISSGEELTTFNTLAEECRAA